MKVGESVLNPGDSLQEGTEFPVIVVGSCWTDWTVDSGAAKSS